MRALEFGEARKGSTKGRTPLTCDVKVKIAEKRKSEGKTGIGRRWADGQVRNNWRAERTALATRSNWTARNAGLD